MAEAGSLLVGVQIDQQQLNKSIAELNTKMQKSASDISASFAKVGAGLSLLVTAPIVIGFGKAIKAAAEFEQINNKFVKTFKGVGVEAEKASDTLRKAYGLPQAEAKELLASTGNFLKSMGATSKEALKLSESTQKLAVDLSVYNNLTGGSKQASDIITRALAGQTRGLLQLGIKIEDAEIKQKLLLKGQQNLTGEALQLAKAEATLALIYEKGGDAIGAYADNVDTYAVVVGNLKGAISDISVEFGKVLLPIAAKVAAVLRDLAGWIAELSDGSKVFLVVLGAIAASFGPLLIAVAGAVKAYQTLVVAYNLVTAASTKAAIAQAAAVAPYLALIAPIALLVGAIGRLIFVYQKQKKEQIEFNNALFISLDTMKKMTEQEREQTKELFTRAKAQQIVNKTLAEQNIEFQKGLIATGATGENLLQAQRNIETFTAELIVANEKLKELAEQERKLDESRKAASESFDLSSLPKIPPAAVKREKVNLEAIINIRKDFESELLQSAGETGQLLALERQRDTENLKDEYDKQMKLAGRNKEERSRILSESLQAQAALEEFYQEQSFQKWQFFGDNIGNVLTAAFGNVNEYLRSTTDQFIGFLDEIGGIQELSLKKLKEFLKASAIATISMLQKEALAYQTLAISKIFAKNAFLGIPGLAVSAGESAPYLAKFAGLFAAFELAKTGVRALATGGLVSAPQLALIGEAGREAVLPLTNAKSMAVIGQSIANAMPQQNNYYNDQPRQIQINLDGKQIYETVDRQRRDQARRLGTNNFSFSGVY